SRDDGVSLSALVRGNPGTNRALFWADVEEVRTSRPEPLVRAWQVYFGGHTMWELAERDLVWLKHDLIGRGRIDDRRIVLSAIVRILLVTNRLDQELTLLREISAGQTELEQDLAEYLAPPRCEPSEFDRQMAERRAATAQQTELDKESWRELR